MRLACGLLILVHMCSVRALSTAPSFGLSKRKPAVMQIKMKAELPRTRPPYVLTGLPRPQWRGRMMGWAHSTKAWYALAIGYVSTAASLRSPMPLGLMGILIRVAVAVASSANIFISDGYHNADRRGASALRPEVELFWLRCDYIGISSVLTSLLWLWSYNFGFVGKLPAVCVAGGACTSSVAALAFTVVPRKLGHTLVKAIMAFQFVVLLGYLCIQCVSACPPACSKCRLASVGMHEELSTPNLCCVIAAAQ